MPSPTGASSARVAATGATAPPAEERQPASATRSAPEHSPVAYPACSDSWGHGRGGTAHSGSRKRPGTGLARKQTAGPQDDAGNPNNPARRRLRLITAGRKARCLQASGLPHAWRQTSEQLPHMWRACHTDRQRPTPRVLLQAVPGETARDTQASTSSATVHSVRDVIHSTPASEPSATEVLTRMRCTTSQPAPVSLLSGAHAEPPAETMRRSRMQAGLQRRPHARVPAALQREARLLLQPAVRQGTEEAVHDHMRPVRKRSHRHEKHGAVLFARVLL